MALVTLSGHYLEDVVILTSANCATYLDQSPRSFMDMIRISNETPTEIDRTLSEISSATLDTIIMHHHMGQRALGN